MNKFFSRKFLICATVEIIITIYLFSTIIYVQNADQTGILREWVYFTIFNVVFYYTANDISKALEIYKIINVGKDIIDKFQETEEEISEEEKKIYKYKNNRWK
jgi:hypothetical protein